MKIYLTTTLIFLIICFQQMAFSQNEDSTIYYVGGSMGLGPPIYKSVEIGYAIGGEYKIKEHWGTIVEYSWQSYKGFKEFSNEETGFSISAPSVSFCYHINGESRWDPFFVFGLGYLSITAKKINSSQSDLSFSGVAPHLKLGVRYWISSNVAIRITIGGYQIVSAGADFSP